MGEPVSKSKQKRSHVGLPPGTLLHIGEKKIETVKITITSYDQAHFQEKEVNSVEECLPFRDTSRVTWINIDGIHDVDTIQKIGDYFNIHPLTLEDILNTGHRPKMEDFTEYVFLTLKMYHYQEEDMRICAEQVSLILGSHVVISFQEGEGDIFDPVRKRIRNEKSIIRKMEADYLAYALVDAIVDNYFVILEALGEDIEDVQEELLTDPTTEVLETMRTLKREMIILRKSVWPLREVVSKLERGESPLIKKSTLIYLRDVYDHTIQVIDTVETFRDMLSGMLDIYLSSVSNKMNEVMKVLTIVATIFIPLTFLAGIYGMNFGTMPELQWRWGYPAVLFAMVSIGLLMMVYFRRKKWL
ncbi:MAG: magnesium/cobalt transporter CorA [Theionarchaea archaeon]|nr:MAG: magnesium transporter [Theionarchaea archaeon DG-70-1]MBU7026159.1 magnesium/cobalt transporter CorA [Theionarchaea archaeon]